MNFILKNAVEISPEVLTNSWLYASLDMPGKKRGNRECKPYERLESARYGLQKTNKQKLAPLTLSFNAIT